MASLPSVSLIADANPLIAALLGGKAALVVASGAFNLYAPQFTLFEVESYIPRVASMIGRTELQVFETFRRLPVRACQPSIYSAELILAEQLIGMRDADDVPVVALALALGYPVWTNDRDFDGLADIETVSTAEILARLPHGP